jgi:hypothetical protein
MSHRLEVQRLVDSGSSRAAAAVLAALILASCARKQPAAAPVPEGVALARADNAAMAYECAVDAVLRAGLLLSATDPRGGHLEARSTLDVPGPETPPQAATPVDVVKVGVGPARGATAATRPQVSVTAVTMVPTYGGPAPDGARGVSWTPILTSGRALSAQRAVLETCTGQPASSSQPGA